jgi:hypothetical protein
MTKSVIPQGLDHEGDGRWAQGDFRTLQTPPQVLEVIGDQTRPQPPLVGAKATTGSEARIHRRPNGDPGPLWIFSAGMKK